MGYRFPHLSAPVAYPLRLYYHEMPLEKGVLGYASQPLKKEKPTPNEGIGYLLPLSYSKCINGISCCRKLAFLFLVQPQILRLTQNGKSVD